jgi:hypothetical protein
MISPRRAAQRSLVATGSDAANELRRAELQNVNNSLKRTALLGLHQAARRNPRLVAKVFGLDYQELDPEPIGRGSQSTVYRLGEHYVLKVVDASLDDSLQAQHEKASAMTRDHAMLRHYLGNMVVPHRVFVHRHPFDYTQTAIQIKQPYVEVTDPHLFIPGSGAVHSESVTRVKQNFDLDMQIRSLLASSWQMHDKTFNKLLVDVRGQGNLGLDAHGSLRILDGQPVGNDIDPGSHQQIAIQHYRLFEELASEAA